MHLLAVGIFIKKLTQPYKSSTDARYVVEKNKYKGTHPLEWRVEHVDRSKLADVGQQAVFLA